MGKNIHSEEQIFEYDKITDKIYIGTNQCCQIHFSERLLKKGVKADISLEENKVDHPIGVDYYPAAKTSEFSSRMRLSPLSHKVQTNLGFKAEVKIQGLCDLWLPTRDHKAPTQRQLLIGASFIEKLIKNKIKVYVHCKNGHGRAPTLVAAYFVLTGASSKRAFELIRNKRKLIHPNFIQTKAVEIFENKIRGNNEK